MGKHLQARSQEFYGQDAYVSSANEGFCKKPRIWSVLIFILSAALVMTILGAYYFGKSSPKKVYELEQTFLSNTEKEKILLKIDPVAWTESFQTGKGSQAVFEIHDFKNGITGLFLGGDPKCLIQNQIKGIPETSQVEMEEPEGEETAIVYFEQSVIWVRGEMPIENKDFLKGSKIFDLCKNVTAYWIHPVLLREPNILDSENEGPENLIPRPEEQGQQESQLLSETGSKRQIRQLTEEDLPINDYAENGLEFHPLWDERGYCCARCRRAHRYCRRVCEPMLGYYPYPYCYQGGRVICRIIMPCNWWIARMLGRV